MNPRWNPNQYSETELLRISTCKKLLQWAKCETLAGYKILDIGSGNGAIDDFLIREYPDIMILAIDSDEAMIEYSKQKYEHRNLQFMLMDARDINMASEFDYILSLACLHWVKDQERVLTGVYRALKSGGHALFVIYPEQPYLWKAIHQIIERPMWCSFFKGFNHGYCFYDERSYQQMSEKAGFQVANIETATDSLNLPSQQAFESLVSSWLPHLTVLPTSQHQAFLREVSNQVLAMMVQDGLSDFSDYRGKALRIHLIKH